MLRFGVGAGVEVGEADVENGWAYLRKNPDYAPAKA